MESLLNLEELAVFLSVCGVLCWGLALGVRRSAPWGESATFKKVLLGAAGGVFQVPIALVIVVQPPYVTGAYTVIETVDPWRILAEYMVVAAVFAGVALLGRWMG